jgi:uncharacterized protein YjiS (DUF1127 family)
MVCSLINSSTQFVKQYFRYRKIVDELNNLSTRDLADLGISRCDIEYIAKQNSFGTKL